MFSKKIDPKFFAVSTPNNCIYTQRQFQRIKQNNSIEYKNYKSQTHSFKKKLSFLEKMKTKIIDESKKSTCTSLRKTQNKKTSHSSQNKLTRQSSINSFDLKKIKRHQYQISKFPVTDKNLILSQKYNFSLYANDNKIIQKESLNIKQNFGYKKIQKRSYTQHPYLKGLNSEKIRIYGNWMLQKSCNQKQKQYLNYEQNLKNQHNNTKELVFLQKEQQTKFFICKNCLQIFLNIELKNHNQVCQLIYSTQQLYQKLSKIGIILQNIFYHYYHQRFKYRCYLDTSLLITKIIEICKQNKYLLKNLKNRYQIQDFESVMNIIQKNMMKDQLYSKKLIFQNIHSLKDSKYLKPLINEDELFWLIGKLLQKLAYQRLSQFLQTD